MIKCFASSDFQWVLSRLWMLVSLHCSGHVCIGILDATNTWQGWKADLVDVIWVYERLFAGHASSAPAMVGASFSEYSSRWNVSRLIIVFYFTWNFECSPADVYSLAESVSRQCEGVLFSRSMYVRTYEIRVAITNNVPRGHSSGTLRS